MTAILASVDVESAARTMLYWVGHSLLFGTVLAVLTWGLLRLLNDRIRPSIHAALWLIVLVKFLVPFGPSWSLSLASMAHELGRLWTPEAPAPPPAPPPQIASSTVTVVTVLCDPKPVAAAPAATEKSSWPIGTVLGGLYLTGLLMVGGLRVWSYRRFVAPLARLPLLEGEPRELVHAVCRRLGVRRIPVVRLSDEAPAPFIFGVFRPTLVLARRQLPCPEELEAVVLHEIAHLRRGDLIVRYWQWIAGTILYFWPVVAWVNRRIDLSREHACDEWALRHGRLSAGQYARCLLKAMHPLPQRRSLYAPAAMAANVFTIERRIEMILQKQMRRPWRATYGLTAAAVILAWSGFVLTGAASADQPSPNAPDQPKNAEKKVIVVAKQVDGGEAPAGEAGKVKVIVDAAAADAGGQPVMVKVACAGAGADKDRQFTWIGEGEDIGPGKAVFLKGLCPDFDMTKFAAAHPTADADADGQVTHAEHDAYLIALAMSDPSKVIEKYPAADRNQDGRLDVDEAARWVSGDMIVETVTAVHGDGPTPFNIPLPPPDGEEQGASPPRAHAVFVKKIAVGEAGVWHDETIETTDGEGGVIELPAFGPAVGRWLLENIAGTPSAADVTRYVPAAQEAPLKALLERHPEADTDGDGRLTPAEKDAFFAKLHERVAGDLFERFPEADTDGDGKVTQEELIKLHLGRLDKSDAAGAGCRVEAKVVVIKSGEGDQEKTEETHEVVVELVDPDGAAK